jgi:hypothetical protein
VPPHSTSNLSTHKPGSSCSARTFSQEAAVYLADAISFASSPSLDWCSDEG